MDKFMLALKSRTIWVLVLTLCVNAIPAIRQAFPSAGWLETANTLLLALAAYFKLNPSANYGTPPTV